MTEERFVRDRLPRWTELRALLRRAQTRGLRSFSGAEVRRLGALYRAATTDLALARTLRLSDDTIQHVNRLCAGAHDLVYASRRRGAAGRIARFLAGGFPALARRTLGWHALAAGVFLLAAVASFAVFRADPELGERVAGPVMSERAERVRTMEEDSRRYLEVPPLLSPALNTGLIANNVNVTLQAFAGGALLGVGAIFVMVVNGINLGAAFALFHAAGVAGVLATFVAAHGPIELTAIFIAAGAGLRVGFALLLPGRRTRAAAFRETARESAALLGGTAFLLAVAGCLEGFVSPSALPPAVKWTVGAVAAAGLAWYLARAGRGGERAAADPA